MGHRCGIGSDATGSARGSLGRWASGWPSVVDVQASQCCDAATVSVSAVGSGSISSKLINGST